MTRAPVDLARRFVEHMVAGADAVPGGSAMPNEAGAVDWEGIWAGAAATQATPEAAVGRFVLVAHDAVRGEGAAVATAPLPAPPAPPRTDEVPVVVVAPASAAPAPDEDEDDDAERTTIGSPEGSGQPATRRVPREASRRRLATVSTWVRNIGAVILLFVAWQLWGTAIGEHHAQAALSAQFDAKVHSGAHPPGVQAAVAGTGSGAASRADRPAELIPAAQQFQSPAEGSPVARLSIPKISLDQVVVSGTSTADLDNGPGHYVGTALPGQAGNVAIAGHRTTHGAPFNGLGKLTPGDPITLTTTWGERLAYVVSEAPFTVSPSDTGVLDYAGDNRLTLTTCNPEFSAAQRLIVVAKLKQPLAPTTATASVLPPHSYRLVSNVDAGWNWGQLPATLAVIAALVALGLGNRRIASRFDTVGRWLVLVPVWATGLYLLFQTLERFLPASV
jgi:sortase A